MPRWEWKVVSGQLVCYVCVANAERIMGKLTSRAKTQAPARRRHYCSRGMAVNGDVDRAMHERLSFIQHDRWFARTTSQSGTDVVYSQDACCYCARPVQIDAARLRTARSNDGEWWLVGSHVDLRADKWRDFQRQNDGTFAPTFLPVGSDCLRRHPEWRFAVITAPKESAR